MSKFTPGPWAYSPGHGSVAPIVQRGEEGGFFVMGTSPESQEADARLIAAAPELLEALKSCVSQIEWWQREHGCCKGASDEELIAARAAIAKAEGVE